jgi:fructoselysine-6-P-deglycase FrlB-like protein
MEWLDRLAEALGEETLSGQEVDRLLQTSREVAHRVERKATPLAAYLVGIAVGRSAAQGAAREAAFDTALDAVLVRLPDAADPSPDDA